jgi:hypothetical protein
MQEAEVLTMVDRCILGFNGTLLAEDLVRMYWHMGDPRDDDAEPEDEGPQPRLLLDCECPMEGGTCVGYGGDGEIG